MQNLIPDFMWEIMFAEYSRTGTWRRH